MFNYGAKVTDKTRNHSFLILVSTTLCGEGLIFDRDLEFINFNTATETETSKSHDTETDIETLTS